MLFSIREEISEYMTIIDSLSYKKTLEMSKVTIKKPWALNLDKNIQAVKPITAA